MAKDLARDLKRRFHRFLERPLSTSRLSRELHQAIIEVFRRIEAREWPAYVVGGTLRDLLLAPRNIWPRDIDVVISGVSLDRMESEFGDLLRRRTRFGGLHLVRRCELSLGVFEIHFDIWPLAETWALKEFGLDPTMQNFVETPFLNIDAVGMELFTTSGNRRFFEHGFLEAIERRTLDLNFAPNPFPVICGVRSLILAAQLQFAIGKRLAEYIQHNCGDVPVERLIEAQVAHYGVVRCESSRLGSWLDTIHRGLQRRADTITLEVSCNEQLSLWENWPPHNL